MFNALKYTQELERVGFTREQAEKSVKILMEIMQENLATKHDVKDLRQEMKDLGAELRQEVKELESKMDSRFRELELRMTIKLGSLMVLTVGVVTAISKWV